MVDHVFDIYKAHYESPVGALTISADYVGITKLEFGKFDQPRGSSTVLKQALKNLDQYFEGRLYNFDCPLSLKGSSFQKHVWQALQRIPYGAFPSYSDIAADIGRPSAVRAVGLANNKNPIPIIIPCHRVIGRDGSLTGYVAGLGVKRFLLDLELQSDALSIPRATLHRAASGQVLSEFRF